MSIALGQLAAPLLLLASLTAEAAIPTLTAPAKVFDLHHFRLGLPVNQYGLASGEAATVSNADLNGPPGYRSRYFFMQSDGAMVFHAPSNGATTTPGTGSDHSRSELRELYTLDGATEWSNRIGGRMQAECLVHKTGAKASATVIGQIHGLDSLLLTLAFRPDEHTVTATVWDEPNSLGTRRLVLATNVVQDETIRYAIQWIGRTLSVTVNGRTENLITASSWDGVPVYFKAGAYSTAPASGNLPFDATEVWFYSLQIQH